MIIYLNLITFRSAKGFSNPQAEFYTRRSREMINRLHPIHVLRHTPKTENRGIVRTISNTCVVTSRNVRRGKKVQFDLF